MSCGEVRERICGCSPPTRKRHSSRTLLPSVRTASPATFSMRRKKLSLPDDLHVLCVLFCCCTTYAGVSRHLKHENLSFFCLLSHPLPFSNFVAMPYESLNLQVPQVHRFRSHVALVRRHRRRRLPTTRRSRKLPNRRTSAPLQRNFVIIRYRYHIDM